MKPAHPPGPWEAFAGLALGYDVIGVNSVSDKSRAIAITGLQRANDEAQSIANAYLIAAAPEMLELLIYLRDCAESGELPSAERWLQVQAVIKKITGRTDR